LHNKFDTVVGGNVVEVIVATVVAGTETGAVVVDFGTVVGGTVVGATVTGGGTTTVVTGGTRVVAAAMALLTSDAVKSCAWVITGP
jgi:hypothetical protein